MNTFQVVLGYHNCVTAPPCPLDPGILKVQGVYTWGVGLRTRLSPHRLDVESIIKLKVPPFVFGNDPGRDVGDTCPELFCTGCMTSSSPPNRDSRPLMWQPGVHLIADVVQRYWQGRLGMVWAPRGREVWRISRASLMVPPSMGRYRMNPNRRYPLKTWRMESGRQTWQEAGTPVWPPAYGLHQWISSGDKFRR